MKNAAMSLPGGHMGNETITTLTQILEEQAEQKRLVGMGGVELTSQQYLARIR
jgi:hypothetical protein